MRAIVRRAVWQAFRALGDYVEAGELQLQNTEGFDWNAAEPTQSPRVIPVEVVLVDEKLKSVRDGTQQHWAIIKTDIPADHFAVLKVGSKQYRCGTPQVSYRFVTLVEVYEIQ